MKTIGGSKYTKSQEKAVLLCSRCGEGHEQHLELSCNHLYCLGCISKLFVPEKDSKIEQNMKVSCEECQKETNLTPRTLKALQEADETWGSTDPKDLEELKTFEIFKNFEDSHIKEVDYKCEESSLSNSFSKSGAILEEKLSITDPCLSKIISTFQRPELLTKRDEEYENTQNEITKNVESQHSLIECIGVPPDGAEVRSKLLSNYLESKRMITLTATPKSRKPAWRENEEDNSLDEGLYCFTCERGEVTSEELLEGRHYQHDVKHYKKGAHQLKRRLQETKIKFESMLEFLRLDAQKLTTKREEIQVKGNELKQMIFSNINEVRRRLEIKEKELMEEVEASIQDKLTQVNKSIHATENKIKKAKEQVGLLFAYTNEQKQRKVYRIVTEKSKELAQLEVELKADTRPIEDLKVSKISVRTDQLQDHIERLHCVELEIAGLSLSDRFFAQSGISEIAADSTVHKENRSTQLLLSASQLDFRRFSRGDKTQDWNEREPSSEPETRIEQMVRKRAEHLGITLDQRLKTNENDFDSLVKLERTRPKSINSRAAPLRQSSPSLRISQATFATTKYMNSQQSFFQGSKLSFKERSILGERLDLNSPILQALESQKQLYSRGRNHR